MASTKRLWCICIYELLLDWIGARMYYIIHKNILREMPLPESIVVVRASVNIGLIP